MLNFDSNQVYNALLELEVIPLEKLKEALEESRVNKTPFDEVLLSKELISDENLGEVIAQTLKVPFINLSKVHISDDLLLIIPEVLARKSYLIAFERNKDGVKLAMNNPIDTELISLIGKKTGEKIIPYYATKQDIAGALKHYQKKIQKTSPRNF